MSLCHYIVPPSRVSVTSLASPTGASTPRWRLEDAHDVGPGSAPGRGPRSPAPRARPYCLAVVRLRLVRGAAGVEGLDRGAVLTQPRGQRRPASPESAGGLEDLRCFRVRDPLVERLDEPPASGEAGQVGRRVDLGGGRPEGASETIGLAFDCESLPF
jgi:hypothetical protein